MWKPAWDTTSAKSVASGLTKGKSKCHITLQVPTLDFRLEMPDLYAFTKPGDPDKSILILNVHPSFRLDSPEPTTSEPFKPGALYEFKIDINGDAVADLGCSVQFSSSGDGKQTATVRRLLGARAGNVGDGDEVI